MMRRWRDWYVNRTPREKRLLLLMLAVTLPTLGWLLVVSFNGAYDSALQDHLEAADRNGRVRALAESARTRPASERAPSERVDLALVITESAAQGGLVLQGANPSGPNVVDVQVSGARATAVTQWLRELDARGIVVDELRITPAADRTVAASARLARRL